VVKVSGTEQTTTIVTVYHSSTSTESISAAADNARVVVLKSASVQELARTLNTIKVTPRDMISIFQALKEAGALQAELVII
ncbi:MAG: flagellar basal body P-ring protein FlgI, partial [Candidatus Cloacimonetes bacterium]|nr:flagellar basal body P-ring protein FlgI [Candidatus Cloacimonadota bacterium]